MPSNNGEVRTYSVATETASGSVKAAKLFPEVAALGLSQSLVSVDVDGDVLELHFAAALSAGDITALDPAVAAHVGTITTTTIKATTVLTQQAAVPSGETWQDIGGVVTNPQAFHANLSEITAKVIGSFGATGTGAQLRLIERHIDASETVISATYSIPDSSGAVTPQSFLSNVATSAGTNTFVLQGRLNGATSANVCYCSATLLSVVVS